MISIGVLGAGHLGKIHLKLLKNIEEFELKGFYDPDAEKTKEAEKKFGIPSFGSAEELIDACDAVDIVTPTLSHFECAKKALNKSKHIFIEKPLTETINEGEALLKLVSEANVKAMVGHVERFNPAFLEAQKYSIKPLFIESHRLAEYNPRGTDVSVVLDLMIHDIDIILTLANSGIKSIQASGVAVISDSPDIANARIEFNSGCIANITASRISLKRMRKMRIFQKNAYLKMDFAENKMEMFSLKDVDENTNPNALIIDPGNGKAKKEITYSSPDSREINAIEMELKEFAASIINNTQTPVTIDEALASLKVAHEILDKLNAQNSLLL